MSAVLPPAPVFDIKKDYKFPQRPSFGTLGRKTRVLTNHFKVEYNTRGNDIYHYDLTVAKSGEKPKNENGFSKAICQKILTAALKDHKSVFGNITVVCDGRKNLYTTAKLPFSENIIKDVILPEEKGIKENPSKFDVYIKVADPASVKMSALEYFFSGKLNYTPYECIQALDVALRNTSSQRFVTIGRNFFGSLNAKQICEGAEIWYGFHQSLRPTQSKLTINLDIAATAFVRSMPVLDFVKEALNSRDQVPKFRPKDHSIVSKAIKGVKIRVTHRGDIRRQYRVNGLSKEPADQLFFEDDKGKKISVAQHFANAYKPLKYPQLYCLHVGALHGHNYLPMEVCHIIEGQKVPRKISDKQVADMIKVTCVKPQERVKQINDRFKQAGFDKDNNIRAFGLRVDPNMITSEARVLSPPDLTYGKNQTERPSMGQWNMKGKGFFDPRNVDSMAVINFDTRLQSNKIDKFLDEFYKMMRSVNMKPPSKKSPVISSTRRGDTAARLYNEAIFQANKIYGKEPQFIICIKQSTDSTQYGEIKRASDTENGIVSQCLVSKNVERCNMQYIANVLLKINVKLQGKNTVIHGRLPCISDAPTIVFGADVTHPSPMDKSRPSIAAVVASMDPYAVSYAAAIRKQGHRIEQIEDMKGLTIVLLRRFYIATKRKPARIIFYRDGVSEGQFQMVLNYEFKAIKEACKSLEKDYNPGITFIVVQKRHHTRCFPTSPNDSDRSGNCVPGTIVEKDICHPFEYDFYLVSHSGIQGTSRPTHYHVLADENKFSVDELQSTTYKLCYTFARCTRSVSIVPAAYYAHLVAFRARFFLEDSSDQGSAKSGDETTSKMHEVHNKLDRIMYYV